MNCHISGAMLHKSSNYWLKICWKNVVVVVVGKVVNVPWNLSCLVQVWESKCKSTFNVLVWKPILSWLWSNPMKDGLNLMQFKLR